MGALPDWMIEKEIKITPFSPAQKRPGVISYGLSSYGYDARVGYKFKIFNKMWGEVIDPKNFSGSAFQSVDLTPTCCVPEPFHFLGDSASRRELIRCMHCRVLMESLDESRFCSKDRPPGFIMIPPNSFALGESLEHFDIPRDVLAICLGKSTYARCGVIANVTPLEPEWRGEITIEISNTTPLPAKIYAGEGIIQILFIRTDGVARAIQDGLLDLLLDYSVGYPHNDETDSMKNQILDRFQLTKTTCRQSYADKAGKYQNQSGLTLPKVDQKEDKT